LPRQAIASIGANGGEDVSDAIADLFKGKDMKALARRYNALANADEAKARGKQTAHDDGRLALPVPMPLDSMSVEDAKELLAVNEGKTASDRVKLRAVLARNPKVASKVGALARLTEGMLLDGNWPAGMLRQGIELELDRMRADLGYNEGSELEKMLIDRLLACWLNVQRSEQRRAAVLYSEPTLEVAAYLRAELETANANFLRASKTLATVRKLLRPLAVVAQLNIGGQQVNISKGSQ
jgi:hypothetical protein